MILKKISLNNIRSYEKEEVEFEKGSVLLSGDIGSGKTSILLAIEFALFGLQPGQRGSSILRNGAVQGGVSIEFEIDNQNILIERTLKRSKTVSQDYAAITINEEKEEISVSELKNRVLKLLKYPKEFAKKQNLLYKFTVYTPQEEMKQIILQDPKTRINTLRHIFGIDKYKKVLENTSIILSKIKEEKKLKQGMIYTLETDKENLKNKEQEIDSRKKELLVFESDFLVKKQQREEANKKLDEISMKRQEKIRLEQELEKNKLMSANKNSSILENNKLKEQLNLQINELKKSSFNESELINLNNELNLEKNAKKELENKIIDLTIKISSLTSKNQENESIRQKLSHIEVCPTCLQDVNENYKNNVLIKIKNTTIKNNQKIDSLLSEKQEFLKKIKEIEDSISKKEVRINELNILKIKMQGVTEKQIQIQEIEKSNDLIQKDLNILEKQSEILKASILEYSKYDLIFEENKNKLEEAIRQEKISEIKLAESRKEIQVFLNQINELKERIEKTELIKMQIVYLIDLEEWISKQFIPMVSSIEKNVMNKLKSEFSKLFSDWFSKLVSESFNVSLDDEFTPIVEQQDYVIDYNYLSGGERTAIALAYRLALNQVINSLLSEIKTKGFIILDEPTDGFSEQQLEKIRDVLEELNVEQLIMVSHEQKIEGFVDKVIKFNKENGKSFIELK